MAKSTIKTRPSWRIMSITQEPRGRVSALSVLAVLTMFTVAGAAGYAIYFMHSLSMQFRQLSTQVQRLDKLDSAADDIHRMSIALAIVQPLDARITRMESYMSYIPKLARTGDQALAQAIATNRKLGITNQRLLATDTCLTGTIDRDAQGRLLRG